MLIGFASNLMAFGFIEETNFVIILRHGDGTEYDFALQMEDQEEADKQTEERHLDLKDVLSKPEVSVGNKPVLLTLEAGATPRSSRSRWTSSSEKIFNSDEEEEAQQYARPGQRRGLRDEMDDFIEEDTLRPS
jgi:transcription elongation factor SPT6